MKKAQSAKSDGDKILQLVDENRFELFEMKGRSVATVKIAKHIDRFFSDLYDICFEFCSLGATDTASRDAIAVYIAREKLGLVKLDPIPTDGQKKVRRSAARRKRPIEPDRTGGVDRRQKRTAKLVDRIKRQNDS